MLHEKSHVCPWRRFVSTVTVREPVHHVFGCAMACDFWLRRSEEVAGAVGSVALNTHIHFSEVLREFSKEISRMLLNFY